MKNRIGNVLVWTLGLAFLGTGVCLAQGAAEPKHDRGAKDGIFKELNLTPEQEARLGEFRKQESAQRKEVMGQLREDRGKLRDELAKPKSDQAEVQRLATEIKTLQAKMVDSEIAAVQQMKTIMTPEQFAKFHEIMKQRFEKREKQGPPHPPMPEK